jgi:hypothetical protein
MPRQSGARHEHGVRIKKFFEQQLDLIDRMPFQDHQGRTKQKRCTRITPFLFGSPRGFCVPFGRIDDRSMTIGIHGFKAPKQTVCRRAGRGSSHEARRGRRSRDNPGRRPASLRDRSHRHQGAAGNRTVKASTASWYLVRSIMDWWLTQMGRVPIGPVSTELLLKGIRAGEVPNDVLVCEVGGRQWRKVTDVAPFGTALTERGRGRRFDPQSERTVLDPQSFPPSEPAPPRQDTIPVRRAEESAAAHRLLPVEPVRSDQLRRADDVDDEKTIVDAFPLLPSEPPKDAESERPRKGRRRR